MSLNYDFTEIDKEKWIPTLDVGQEEGDNSDEVREKQEDFFYQVLDACIWKTISTDVGEYNEKNHGEIMKRIRFLETLHGLTVTETSEDGVKMIPFPEEWVRMCWGLKTNVFPLVPWSKWVKKQVKIWETDYNRGYK